ncbi:hypothetical protein [Allosalinactinospora lopnorensis]|uniref:hypothetical protein n=1 Tax=Allosalinactinospora lopnorensis TaxID=1352348 RepID=UPI000A80C23E|nr:hypothetical protein [Allosalinactinospora lopnorensis]
MYAPQELVSLFHPEGSLAIAYPLLELYTSKAKAERGWHDYRLNELALAAIDIVALRTDLNSVVRQEAVVEEVAGFAGLQVPGRSVAEYRAVSQWVVERLINTEERDRVFRHVVGNVVDCCFCLWDFPFQILKEVPDEVGQAALTVTDVTCTGFRRVSLTRG